MLRALKKNQTLEGFLGEASGRVDSFVTHRQDRIESALDIELGEKLGCGSWGCAYVIDSGSVPPEGTWVIKITADDEEGRMWQRIWALQRQGHLLPGLPVIHQVVGLRSDDPSVAGMELYAVIREELEPIENAAFEDPVSYADFRILLDQYRGAVDYFYDTIVMDGDPTMWVERMEATTAEMKEIDPILVPFAMTLDELASMDIPPRDLHAGNIAVRTRPTLGRPASVVFMDPGVTPGGEPVQQELVANPSWASCVSANERIETMPLESIFVERLSGGRSSGMRPEDFDQAELRRGAQHEMEHTNDDQVAIEIAMDHLAEDRDYYKKLERMESGMKPNRDLHNPPYKLMVFYQLLGPRTLPGEWHSYESAEAAALKIADSEDVEEVRIVQEEFSENQGGRPFPDAHTLDFDTWRTEYDLATYDVQTNEEARRLYDYFRSQPPRPEGPRPRAGKRRTHRARSNPPPELTAGRREELRHERAGTRGKVRKIVREYEEEERPFDPEEPPSWRSRPGELVINGVTVASTTTDEEKRAHAMAISKTLMACDTNAIANAIREAIYELGIVGSGEDKSDYIVGLVVKYGHFQPEENDIELIDRYVKGYNNNPGIGPNARNGSAELQKYDVLQISRDSGATWLDFSTLRDPEEFEFARRYVEDPRAWSVPQEGKSGDSYRFRVRRQNQTVLERELQPNARKRCPVGTEVQTLIFSKDDFTQAKAKAWAKREGMKHGKVDEKEDTYRLRQVDPKEFKRGSFRTIRMADGVKAVVGCPKE